MRRPTDKKRRVNPRFPESSGALVGEDGAGRQRWKKRPAPPRAKRDDRDPRPARDAAGAPPAPAPARKGGPRPLKPTGAPTELMRIAKAMARAGLCSRRAAETWILEGRVRVNGKAITSPALTVGPRDRIEVDGDLLPAAEPPRLWRYHKPKGLVTTHKDPEGRPTVFDKLPNHLPRVISIGRLDFNTEGLLLLTNDGELARHLELPATGWLRRYRVRAHGTITQDRLNALKDGIELEGVRYGPIEATLDQVQGANVWMTIGLREGKNREVRKIMDSLSLTVNRLIRVSFGPFQLLDLPQGEVESIKRRVLADQLGPDLARTFGLEAPPEEASAPGRGERRERKPRRDESET